MKQNIITTIKKYILLIVGLFIMSFGVAFSIKAGLGTSPISSLPYVLSLCSTLTVGNITIIMHCVFILLQIILLRKQYEWIQLMQLPVAFIFGYLTDFALWAIRGITAANYMEQWILCIIGVVLVGIAVGFEVTAGVVTLAGEGLVLAICKVAPIKFAKMKVLFDISLVAAASILSFVFLGKLMGVREGTVIAAIFVGIISKLVIKPLKIITVRYLCIN